MDKGQPTDAVLDSEQSPKTKEEFIRQMERKYLACEDLWWMTERPGEVLQDISLLIAEFKDTLWFLDNIMGEQ